MRTTLQKSTESTIRELTPKQNQVINVLAHGSSVTNAATQGEVDRTTIYQWMRRDALFVAELNRALEDRRDVSRAQLGELASEASNVVSDLLKGEDTPAAVRLKTALCVLQAVGALSSRAIGRTDPEAIEEEWKQDETDRRRREFFNSLPP
jgi:hypothetical protein